jgi:hypothetical protein
LGEYLVRVAVFSSSNQTVENLKLDYIPFHWPTSRLYRHQSSFWVWLNEHDRRKKNFEKLSKPFFDVLELISPQSGWIEADCICALVPNTDGKDFSVQINGRTLAKFIYKPHALRRRLLALKEPIRVTTCNAKICGKGLESFNQNKGYFIALDMKPLSIKWHDA